MAFEIQGVHRVVRAALEAINPVPVGGVHKDGFGTIKGDLPRIVFELYTADDINGPAGCTLQEDVVYLVQCFGKPLTDAELTAFEKLANSMDSAMCALTGVNVPADPATGLPAIYLDGFYREEHFDRPAHVLDVDGNRIPVRSVGGLYRSTLEAPS